MMFKVTKIIEVSPYFIICEVNDSFVKKVNVLPLLENHKKLKGIEKLKDFKNFSKVKIGSFGELFWEDIIENSSGIWNYDISPEFIMEYGENVKMA